MENLNQQEQKFVNEKIKAFELAGDWIPGIKIIQRIHPFENLYICGRGITHFKISQSFFKHLMIQEFREKIFDPKDPSTCLVGIKEIDNPTLVSKKVYIRNIHMDSKKSEVDLIIEQDFFQDKYGSPRIRMFQVLPFSLQAWAAPKTKKIVEEVSFQKSNRKKFSNLTHRNREVLSLWAQSFKAEEIGEKLFIGVNSVNSHKKRIKEILDISNNADVIRYGKAFDLF